MAIGASLGNNQYTVTRFKVQLHQNLHFKIKYIKATRPPYVTEQCGFPLEDKLNSAIVVFSIRNPLHTVHLFNGAFS